MADLSKQELISALSGFTLIAISREAETLTLSLQWALDAAQPNPDIYLLLPRCKKWFFQPVRNGGITVDVEADLLALQLRLSGEALQEDHGWKLGARAAGMKEPGLLHVHSADMQVLDQWFDPLTAARVNQIRSGSAESEGV